MVGFFLSLGHCLLSCRWRSIIRHTDDEESFLEIYSLYNFSVITIMCPKCCIFLHNRHKSFCSQSILSVEIKSNKGLRPLKKHGYKVNNTESSPSKDTTKGNKRGLVSVSEAARVHCYFDLITGGLLVTGLMRGRAAQLNAQECILIYNAAMRQTHANPARLLLWNLPNMTIYSKGLKHYWITCKTMNIRANTVFVFQVTCSDKLSNYKVAV